MDGHAATVAIDPCRNRRHARGHLLRERATVWLSMHPSLGAFACSRDKPLSMMLSRMSYMLAFLACVCQL